MSFLGMGEVFPKFKHHPFSVLLFFLVVIVATVNCRGDRGCVVSMQMGL